MRNKGERIHAAKEEIINILEKYYLSLVDYREITNDVIRELEYLPVCQLGFSEQDVQRFTKRADQFKEDDRLCFDE